MEKKINKIIKICDVCEIENTYLQDCIVCGKEYCILCGSVMPGCMVSVNCCKKCGESDDVIEIVEEYAKPIVKIVEQRNNKLQRINKKG